MAHFGVRPSRTDGGERSPSARRSSLRWSTKSAGADLRTTKMLIDMLEDNETCPLDTELGGTHLPGREARPCTSHCTSERQPLATLEHTRRIAWVLSRRSANNPRTLRSGGRQPIPAGALAARRRHGHGVVQELSGERTAGSGVDVGGLPQKLRRLIPFTSDLGARRMDSTFVPPSYGKATPTAAFTPPWAPLALPVQR
jgi:hypothetical protein